jgi:hypothetical protein
MAFDMKKELVNNDSKVKNDVESLARIILSEIEYILKIIEGATDGRLARILLESAVTKTAAVFQLALRACEYLENSSYKNEIINTYFSLEYIPNKAHFEERLSFQRL